MVGVETTLISKYERGAAVPSLPRAFEIAIALRTPVERVFFGLFEVAGDRVTATAAQPGVEASEW